MLCRIAVYGRGNHNPGSEPTPDPAIPAILAAFNKYEVVAMPEDHGLKDLDDLIFALLRNPAFPDKVNDVVVECGNSLYQPLLDRYCGSRRAAHRRTDGVARRGPTDMRRMGI